MLKKIFSKIKTGIELLLMWPTYWLSFLFPRSKKIWLFIGWHLKDGGEILADNTKYLFLQASQNRNLKPIWLTKDKQLMLQLNKAGFASYYQKSLVGIYYSLRAGLTIIDAKFKRQNFIFSGGTKLVHLLHGKGMKKKGYGKKEFKKFSYIFLPSKFVGELLPEKFKSGSKQFITGFPRNDIFFKDIPGAEIGLDTNLQQQILNIKKRAENKLIFYAPTFRRNKLDFDIHQVLDMANLRQFLQKHKFHLFISLHPKYQSLSKEINQSNIYFCGESDKYPIYKYFDLLIGDYSSIFADFLLLDKPMIFYAYDLKEYETKEGFLFDYQKTVPGEVILQASKLPAAILNAFNIDPFKNQRKKIKSLYHQYSDGKAGERIVKELLDHTFTPK